MLTIVGWLWRDEKCRSQYTPEHANFWASMIDQNTTIPHRFVLITDQPEAEFDSRIETVPLWKDWHLLQNPRWKREWPQCYVRLRAFSEEMSEILGPRFVSVDLDCIVTGSLDSVFGRHEDFLIVHRAPVYSKDRQNKYQGSMWMMNSGCRDFVWRDFNGLESADKAQKFLGTDQGWMQYRMGDKEAGWTVDDGVYGFPWIREQQKYRHAPPPNAKIIFFYGVDKPWNYPTAVNQRKRGIYPIAVHRNNYQWISDYWKYTSCERVAQNAQTISTA